MSHTCRECGRRVDHDHRHLVNRPAGGSYRRAARMIPTTLCTECVLSLATRRSPSAQLVGMQQRDAMQVQRIARDLLTPSRPYYLR